VEWNTAAPAERQQTNEGEDNTLLLAPLSTRGTWILARHSNRARCVSAAARRTFDTLQRDNQQLQEQ
jgi:hypothetical protein